MDRSYKNQVKVVIINTQYVETDAISFKEVVQRLTGKDAVVEVAPPPNDYDDRQLTGGNAGGDGQFVVPRSVSFKEFDKLLMDFPSLDELYQLCMD